MRNFLLITMPKAYGLGSCQNCPFRSECGSSPEICDKLYPMPYSSSRKLCSEYDPTSYEVREVEMPTYMEAREIAYNWYRKNPDATIVDAFVAGMAAMQSVVIGKEDVEDDSASEAVEQFKSRKEGK